MKAIVTAAAAAMLLAGPVVTPDPAAAGQRHHWDEYDDGCGYGDCEDDGGWNDDGWDDYQWRRRHRPIVHQRHLRRIQRDGVIITIIVLPGYPAYPGG